MLIPTLSLPSDFAGTEPHLSPRGAGGAGAFALLGWLQEVETPVANFAGNPIAHQIQGTFPWLPGSGRGWAGPSPGALLLLVPWFELDGQSLALGRVWEGSTKPSACPMWVLGRGRSIRLCSPGVCRAPAVLGDCAPLCTSAGSPCAHRTWGWSSCRESACSLVPSPGSFPSFLKHKPPSSIIHQVLNFIKEPPDTWAAPFSWGGKVPGPDIPRSCSRKQVWLPQPRVGSPAFGGGRFSKDSGVSVSSFHK